VTVTVYRICKAENAAGIWTGAGARVFGGRWNSKGVAVVYTAENRSLAAMEQLVHLQSPRALTGYVIASATFDAEHVRRVETKELPRRWKAPVAPAGLKRLGDDWVTAGKHAVLAVPSAVMPGEWNYLLNPAHSAFAGFGRTKPEAFKYDARLG
jgi:RES domain-containing protein